MEGRLVVVNRKKKLTDGLNDHGVDLVGTELELVAGQAVGETDAHGGNFLLGHLDQALHLTADESHQVLHVGVAHAVDVELLLDRAAELGISDEHGLLGVIGDLLEQLLERLGDLALDGGGDGRQSYCGVIELLEVLELKP
jgi:hypothetical protein